MTEVQVQLPDRPYTVTVERGLLNQIGPRVATVWTPRRVAVVTDETVAALYLQRVVSSLTQANFDVLPLVVAPGETSKSLTTAEKLYGDLAQAGFSRSDGVIALGGGVVADLAGFVASTYMRGLPLIQVPTSLLAQVDSSVGGKTALNLGTTKNIVGTFSQPAAVMIDPDVLATLSDRFVAEGYAEVVKMAALNVPDNCWRQLADIQSVADIRKQAPTMIAFAVTAKAALVVADELDTGQRRLLNFGHTIGHAVELLAAGELAHGEAVSIGMVAVTRLGIVRGWSTSAFAAELTARLRAVGLPLTHALVADHQRIAAQIQLDKKVAGDTVHLVCVERAGQPQLRPLLLNELPAFLAAEEV